RGVWEGYVRHVYNVHPILDRASVVGLPVCESKRVGLEVKFKEERKKIHEELQKAIPDELRNIRPKRKLENGGFDYGYKREPKIVGEEFERYTRLSEILKRSGKKVRSYVDFLYRKHGLAYAEFKGTDEGTRLGVNIKRWCVIEEFRASQQQLVRYLKWRQDRIREEANRIRKERDEIYGGKKPELTQRIVQLEELADDYEVPISLKTKRETTSKQELEEMFINTNDPVLEKVVRIRSYDTNINNYLPNWKPSKDGRVHTTWGFTAPSGQFDARRPNILNCSKHTEFGNEFRGIIEAPPGRVFVEFDKKSFHVGTLGYCANDKGYIRFSQLDPHSILGSYIAPDIIGGSISLKWSDEEIIEASREFKKRSKAKGKELHGCDIRQQL
ncbi:MAG TPA: DNA polymerase, partial [Bacteroidia bacterium]|nr:DNA polymerase [Bacteroidia bacterium]